MELRLKMNEFGLYQTADGRFGLRQIADGRWAIQHRDDPDDPWDWEIVEYRSSFNQAVKYLAHMLGRAS